MEFIIYQTLKRSDKNSRCILVKRITKVICANRVFFIVIWKVVITFRLFPNIYCHERHTWRNCCHFLEVWHKKMQLTNLFYRINRVWYKRENVDSAFIVVVVPLKSVIQFCCCPNFVYQHEACRILISHTKADLEFDCYAYFEFNQPIL